MTSEPSPESAQRTIRYTDGTDDVLVVVPWGYHTGMIPPPVLTFGNRAFGYAGDGPDVVLPPEGGTDG